MKPVDVVIYFRKGLDTGSRQFLEKSLRKTPGVVAPWFTPGRNTLMIVYYNPDVTNSLSVLKRVRKLGHPASLVAI
ncbi:MAG: hypothetical protein P8X48_04970 [Acidiferrobacteraceae bacterium]|jgi:hypothetical protein